MPKTIKDKGRPKMVDTCLPTMTEIGTLPLRACVAFAAKCARQAFSVCLRDFPNAPVQSINAVQRAVRFVETWAAGGAPQIVPQKRSVLIDALDGVVHAHKVSPEGGVWRAATVAANAIRATQAAEAPGAHSAVVTLIVKVLEDTVQEMVDAANKRTHFASVSAHESFDGTATDEEVAYGWSVDQSILDNQVKSIVSDFHVLLEACGREKWTDDTFVSPSFFSPDSAIERQIIFLINDLCVNLCELIAINKHALNQIDWRMLEHVIATALAGIGFEIELTPGAKDGGKDIVAKCSLRGRRMTYYLEVKHWRSGKRVGLREVSHFIEVNMTDHTDGGLLLSTSGYARRIFSKILEINQRRIALGGEVKVISLCQQFIQHRGQVVWMPEEVLPKILFEDIR